MGKDVIIALDFKNAKKAFEFLDKFDKKPFVKVGMELYYAEGPDIVKELKRRGHKLFLDLKLHDIPNTVKSAMRVLSSLGADIVDMHAAGTTNMMKQAIEGLGDKNNRPLAVAITQLTSTSEKVMQSELLISSSLNDTVKKYAQNAKSAGLDGVVCSPREAGLVKAACGKDFITITPGIRFLGANLGDQVRVTTPGMAKQVSDYIVVGRPITAADDPVAAYNRCVDEFVD